MLLEYESKAHDICSEVDEVTHGLNRNHKLLDEMSLTEEEVAEAVGKEGMINLT